MTGERFVLLGLAPARAPWFAALSQWATSATIAAEFIKCVSADEVRARLASGRRHSALLVDAASPAFDRDVVDAAQAAMTPVIAVRGLRSPSFAAADLGIVAELPADFGRDDLLDVLTAHCQLIGRGDRLPAALVDATPPVWLGQLITVCGPGGTGASTVAIAVAQGLGADVRNGRRVLLADLARRADQAMLHDAQELGPGTQELVEAHRLGRPDIDEVWRTTFDVPRRGYRLLLGLRRPEAWSALRPRAIDASIDGLRRSFQVVVADVTGDLEGEADGGSVEVEERNHLARSAGAALRCGGSSRRPGDEGGALAGGAGAVVDRDWSVAGPDRDGVQPVAPPPEGPSRTGPRPGRPSGRDGPQRGTRNRPGRPDPRAGAEARGHSPRRRPAAGCGRGPGGSGGANRVRAAVRQQPRPAGPDVGHPRFARELVGVGRIRHRGRVRRRAGRAGRRRRPVRNPHRGPTTHSSGARHPSAHPATRSSSSVPNGRPAARSLERRAPFERASFVRAVAARPATRAAHLLPGGRPHPHGSDRAPRRPDRPLSGGWRPLSGRSFVQRMSTARAATRLPSRSLHRPG